MRTVRSTVQKREISRVACDATDRGGQAIRLRVPRSAYSRVANLKTPRNEGRMSSYVHATYPGTAIVSVGDAKNDGRHLPSTRHLLLDAWRGKRERNGAITRRYASPTSRVSWMPKRGSHAFAHLPAQFSIRVRGVPSLGQEYGVGNA